MRGGGACRRAIEFGKLFGGAAVVFFELKSVPQLKSSRQDAVDRPKRSRARSCDETAAATDLLRLMAQIILAV